MQQTEKSVCMCDCKGRAVAHLFCTTLETEVCGVSDHAWGLPPTREYLSVRETNCSQTAVIADYERCSSELMWLTFPASLRKGLATLFCCRSVMRLTNLKHNHTCYSSKAKFNLICMVQVHLMDDGWQSYRTSAMPYSSTRSLASSWPVLSSTWQRTRSAVLSTATGVLCPNLWRQTAYQRQCSRPVQMN